MPVTPVDPRKPPTSVLPILDFSAGIYSGGGFATRVPPSSPGAAQEPDTYGCIALAEGGLAPLPIRTVMAGPTLHADGIAGAPGGPHVPTGFVFGDDLVGADCFLIVQSGSRVHGYRYSPATTTWAHVPFRDSAGVDYNFLTLVGGTGAFPYSGCSFSYLTYNYVGGTAMPVTTVWDAPGLRMPAGTGRWPFYYDTTALRFKGIVNDGANPQHHAIIVSHLGENANLCRSSNLPYISELTYYEASQTTAGALTPYVNHFFLDHRSFFQTYGSQSTGELLLIARNGPAAVIRGGYDFPQLLLLPGVIPSGTDGMQAISTPVGLLYTSEMRGAFVWNGDNISRFVSPQLRPDFYRRATNVKYAGAVAGPDGNAPSHNVHGAKWGDWAIMPNNWIWEPRGGGSAGSAQQAVNKLEMPGLGAWWKLEQDSAHTSAMWAVNGDGTRLYGVQDQITSADADAIAYYSLASLRSNYSWKSQPMAIGTPGRQVRVHDVEIRAVPSVANTNQTITITVFSSDGTSSSVVFTINGETSIPQRLRAPIHATGHDVIVKVVVDAIVTAPAPVVHGIWLSYTDSGMIGSTETTAGP